MVFVKDRGQDTQIKWHADGTASVTKRSGMSREVHTLTMELTREAYEKWLQGGMIQNVLPHLTPDEREFLMTGITAAEWAYIFKDDEDVD
jgi:hypothetical protein